MTRDRLKHKARRLTVLASAVPALIVGGARPAWADSVSLNPSSAGLTFVAKIQTFLDNGAHLGYMACLAAGIAGGALMGVSKISSNYQSSSKGVALVACAVIGALCITIAPDLVNSMM
jgi:hypothetical protein